MGGVDDVEPISWIYASTHVPLVKQEDKATRDTARENHSRVNHDATKKYVSTLQYLFVIYKFDPPLNPNEKRLTPFP